MSVQHTHTFCCLLTINQKGEIISNPISTLHLDCELLFFCNKKTFTFQTPLKGLGRLWWVKRLHCKPKSQNSRSRIHTRSSTCYHEMRGRVPRNLQVGQPHSNEEIPDQTRKTWVALEVTLTSTCAHTCKHICTCTHTLAHTHRDTHKYTHRN